MDDVWRIAELFDVTVGVVIRSVRQVLREGVLKEYEVCRYIELGNGCYADVMGMDLIMVLAFRSDTFYAYLIRKWIAERCCFSCGKPSYYTVCICIGGHFRVLL